MQLWQAVFRAWHLASLSIRAWTISLCQAALIAWLLDGVSTRVWTFDMCFNQSLDIKDFAKQLCVPPTFFQINLLFCCRSRHHHSLSYLSSVLSSIFINYRIVPSLSSFIGHIAIIFHQHHPPFVITSISIILSSSIVIIFHLGIVHSWPSSAASSTISWSPAYSS